MSKTPIEILGEAEVKRKVANLMRSLTARKRNPGKAEKYLAQGGPFAGQEILLRTSSTLVVRVGDFHGSYHVQHAPGTWRSRNESWTATWKPEADDISRRWEEAS